jgi:hypothetical protein
MHTADICEIRVSVEQTLQYMPNGRNLWFSLYVTFNTQYQQLPTIHYNKQLISTTGSLLNKARNLTITIRQADSGHQVSWGILLTVRSFHDFIVSLVEGWKSSFNQTISMSNQLPTNQSNSGKCNSNYSGPTGYDRLDIWPTWVMTNIFVLTYDRILSYDPRQRQRGEHISDITCSSLQALAVFALFCRRDHANSSYESMYNINKYRVTEKGCVSLMARSKALRPAWHS